MITDNNLKNISQTYLVAAYTLCFEGGLKTYI